MTERVEQIYKAYMHELTLEEESSTMSAIAAVIRECAERLCTDWGELQHPADVLRELADEVFYTQLGIRE